MNDNDKGPQPSARPNQTAAARQPAGRGGGAAVVALTLLVAAGAGGGGWFLWQENRTLHGQVESLRAGVQRQSAEATAQRARIGEAAAAANASAAELGSRLDAVSAVQARLAAQMERTPEAWLAQAETEYLLRIARQRLLLMADRGAAASALQTAAQRLEGLGEPRYRPVQQAIAAALHALAAADFERRERMALEIGALLDGIAQLPVRSPRLAVAEPATAPDEPAARPDDWRGLADAVWHDLKGLVSVRNTREVPDLPLGPAEDFYLRQLLRLKLESARLALLRDEMLVYRTVLTEATHLVERYFAAQAPEGRTLLAALARLAEASPAAPAVDLDAPLAALQAVELDAAPGDAAAGESGS